MNRSNKFNQRCTAFAWDVTQDSQSYGSGSACYTWDVEVCPGPTWAISNKAYGETNFSYYTQLWCLDLTIYNHVYVQRNTYGYFSLHFGDPAFGVSYISMSTLLDGGSHDDGSSLPQWKKFENANYNSLSRTFTGEVNFAPKTY